MTIQALVAEVLAAPPARGRRPAQVEAATSRELGPEDIARLHTLKAGELGTGQSLKKLRHTHHTLARLVAEGTREAECSAITGYSLTYISIIKNDPAFCELVSHYAERKEVVYLDVHERLKGVALNAVEEIQERLSDKPEEFKVRELMEVAQMGLDRSGYGPSKTLNGTQLVALVDASKIEELKNAIRNESRGRVRPLISSSSAASEMGGTLIEGTVARAETSARCEGQGTDLPAQGAELPPKELP